MKRVACIGECMVELSERPDHMLTRGFGGDTLNTALYLARLGVPVDYVTALGSDPFSEEMIQAWKAEGIGTGLIPRLQGRLPGLYLIQTEASGERRFYYWRDSAPVRQLFRLAQTDAIEAALCRTCLVYLSGITLSLFDEASRDRLFGVLANARGQGARIAFDTNFRPSGWPDRAVARKAYDQAFRGSDLVLASVEDCALLYGEAEPQVVINRLRTAGVPEIVVKLPTPACHVMADGFGAVVEAAAVEDVVDTTAAGDSFAAGYVAARRAGSDPVAAARIGHQLAGVVVRHRGAIIPKAAMPKIIFGCEAS
ncbi:MAG TPA: sugar kinase [Acetobacteraceae bacterium]|nr:sugar kinase [Acetobacteraceae bacterium]